MATPAVATVTPKLTRGLDPGSLIPDNLETKRILTVLDKMIDKLELSSMIPCVTESLDKFADILGPEGTTSLMEHQKLSKEMERLRAEDPWGSLSLLEQLKGSTRNVLRLLLPNPAVCQVLKRQALVRESPAKVFIKALKEFRNLVLERLMTSPEEEEEKLRFMKAISLQIKENTETITALEAELAATAQTREEEVWYSGNFIPSKAFLKQNFGKLKSGALLAEREVPEMILKPDPKDTVVIVRYNGKNAYCMLQIFKKKTNLAWFEPV